MPPRSEVFHRWSAALRRSGFFRAGERIGVAVSGGPDSVLLLEYMQEFAREMGLKLAVVHFNHHLRGEESDADERFVEELAREGKLEFIRGEADVAEAARQRRRNVEATARELRYRFFFSLVNHGRLDKVATAHTANDQAETVFLNILRGTGTRGLGGIFPALEGKVARPFLNLTRSEIESELDRRKLRFRLDATNRDVRLRRNKVRLELLPQLARDFNPEIVTALKELADRARDDEDVLEHLARERAHPWRVREGPKEKIPGRALADFPPAIGRRVLRQMILAARGSLRGITHRHIEALRRLAVEAQSGRSLALPGGAVAHRDFDWLVIGPTGNREEIPEFSLPVEVPGEVRVPQLGATFRFKIVGRAELRQAYNESGDAGLDPQKLSGGLILRNWRAGDCFQPLGSRKPRKLKEFFRERRVSLDQRKLWPVLENGREIVWVRGFPPASKVAASPESTQALLILEEKTAPAS